MDMSSMSGLAGLFQQPGKGFNKPLAAAPTASSGWGDRGGNTFLGGMARMNGQTPPPTPAPSVSPGWGDKGGNTFLGGLAGKLAAFGRPTGSRSASATTGRSGLGAFPLTSSQVVS